MMSKYHSTPTEVNGIRFDSKREANRWAELRLMERAGQIQKLKRQVRYLLIPSQYRDGKCVERECSYLADFVYIKDGRLVVEDCKGFRTPEYKIKRKLMLQLYDIRLVET